MTLPSAEAGSKLRFREVTSGGSFGATSLVQHIGLGKATHIEALEIAWPTSKTRQVFRKVPINSHLVIREFDEQFSIRQLPRITLAGPGAGR